jgi:hypothetical protein
MFNLLLFFQEFMFNNALCMYLRIQVSKTIFISDDVYYVS